MPADRHGFGERRSGDAENPHQPTEARAATARRRRRRASLRSYSLIITVVSVTAFLLFAAVFSAVVTSTVNAQRTRMLEKASETLAGRWLYVDPEGDDPTSYHSNQTAVEVASDMTGAYVWIVTPAGVITHCSDLSDKLIEELAHTDSRGYPVLDEKQVGHRVPDTGMTFTSGNYMGMFRHDHTHWVSLVRPLFDDDGERVAYLHMHVKDDILRDAKEFLLNGLGVTLLVSLIVATIFAWIFGRRLMIPLSHLSEAAERVALGDLSVRVDPDVPHYRVLDGEDMDNELERLFITFNRMVESLEHQNQTQKDFVAAISHDLRTPITVIHGFVSGMIDGTIPADLYPHYLKIVSRESQRLAQLVREMHELAVMESGSVTYRMAPFDLAPLIREALQSHEGIIYDKDITVRTTLRPDDILAVVGDQEQFSKVVYNLISNAVKFTPQHGIIEVSATPLKRGLYRVTVEDSGPGIPDDEKPYIFERFYKGDKARSRSVGSGLGLHICRVIVQAHGRTIRVGDSTQLGGAAFDFTVQRIDGETLRRAEGGRTARGSNTVRHPDADDREDHPGDIRDDDPLDHPLGGGRDDT